MGSSVTLCLATEEKREGRKKESCGFCALFGDFYLQNW